MKNLYVGNLAFQITEQDLEQAFARYGQVSRASVVRDRATGQPRGFGFVEMADAAEADKAIAALNGAEWEGRQLTVSEARPREGGGASGGRGGFERGGGGKRGGGGGGGGRGRRW